MKLKQQFLVPGALVLVLGMAGVTAGGYFTSKEAVEDATLHQMRQIADS